MIGSRFKRTQNWTMARFQNGLKQILWRCVN